LSNWGRKYLGHWQTFVDEHQKEFGFDKKIAPYGSLLARNLESILNSLLEHCTNCTTQSNVENVLLFFYNAENSKPLSNTNSMFKLFNIEYGKAFPDRFVALF
jgi:hypothetical protein